MQKTLFDLYRFSVNYGKIFVFAILLLNFASLVSAGPTDGISNLISVLSGLCVSARGLLGVGMMLMIILAGVIYAVGQVMGAETRARATVWATAMLLGALIAGVIYVLVPPILQAVVGGGASGASVTVACQ